MTWTRREGLRLSLLGRRGCLPLPPDTGWCSLRKGRGAAWMAGCYRWRRWQRPFSNPRSGKVQSRVYHTATSCGGSLCRVSGYIRCLAKVFGHVFNRISQRRCPMREFPRRWCAMVKTLLFPFCRQYFPPRNPARTRGYCLAHPSFLRFNASRIFYPGFAQLRSNSKEPPELHHAYSPNIYPRLRDPWLRPKTDTATLRDSVSPSTQN